MLSERKGLVYISGWRIGFYVLFPKTIYPSPEQPLFNCIQSDDPDLTQLPTLHDFQTDIDEIGRSTLVPSLLETLTLATGMGFAAVARVTDSRWVTCRAVDKISFGLKPGDELDVESTLCHEVRLSDAEIIISHVEKDAVYCNHHTPAEYGFQSYISIPIYNKGGDFFGTLCAIDPEPRDLTEPHVLAMFRLFAKMVGDSLETDAKLRESENSVQEERELADIQQEFIAILAHDLRNPISALNAGLRLIKRSGLDEDASQIVTLMNGSLGRMANLIENLLDRARQRLGGGIVIERNSFEPLEPVILQIVSEMGAIAPDHDIECDIDLPQNVNCDRDRIAQMLSNLLGNAVTHGADGRSIRIVAKIVDDHFHLSVANEGKMVPVEKLPKLFLPFHQAASEENREGLGLGLYIASEIAKAHDGTLSVSSDHNQTEFTFRMPHA